MTRVDFYILQKQTAADRHDFTCRLTEKAVAQGNRVMIATENEAETQTLDELLWTFRPESFVPHGTGAAASAAPVLISHSGDDPDHHDLLINLRQNIPPEFSRFQRLAEVVVQEPAILSSTREHFSFYKARGYQMNTHKL